MDLNEFFWLGRLDWTQKKLCAEGVTINILPYIYNILPNQVSSERLFHYVDDKLLKQTEITLSTFRSSTSASRKSSKTS